MLNILSLRRIWICEVIILRFIIICWTKYLTTIFSHFINGLNIQTTTHPRFWFMRRAQRHQATQNDRHVVVDVVVVVLVYLLGMVSHVHLTLWKFSFLKVTKEIHNKKTNHLFLFLALPLQICLILYIAYFS